ncbi:MAG: hypothetical protein CMJ48_01840 [Planctomycetaceae bacterium]|jgi:predicted DNA-binding transcriptional regulator AlpA|nr:hypothetical protein [Planctomycetaceae bacterium]
MATQLDPALCESEAAATLGVAPSTLAHLRMSGKGPPFFRIGRAVRYPQSQLILWRDERVLEARSPEPQTAT